MTARYVLNIPDDIQKRLERCRGSIRTAIEARLREIVVAAGKAPDPGHRTSSPVKDTPPLRFYVYEGYRVLYRLDPVTCRVVVTDLGVAPS